MNIFYYKKTKIDIPKFWGNILKLTVPVMIACIIGIIQKRIINIDSTIKLIGQVVVYTVVYSGLIWKIGMNEYEKNLIKGPLKRMLKK